MLQTRNPFPHHAPENITIHKRKDVVIFISRKKVMMKGREGLKMFFPRDNLDNFPIVQFEGQLLA